MANMPESSELVFAATRSCLGIGGLEAYARHLGIALSSDYCVREIARFRERQVPILNFQDWDRGDDEGRAPFPVQLIGPTLPLGRFLGRLRHLITRPATQSLAIDLFTRAYGPAFEAALPVGVQHIHYVGAGWELLGFCALKAARKRKIPISVWPAVHPGVWGDNRVDFRFYQQVDALFAQSDYERNHLIANGISPEKVHLSGLAPCTSAVGDGDRFRREHRLGMRPLVLFVARKSRYKGYHALLAAMPTLIASVPDVMLVAIGAPSEPPYPDIDPAHILDLGIATEQQKADALAACDLFCMPSEAEAFGIAYVEAWAYGKAVIGGTAPAVRELITDGLNGFCVEQIPDKIAQIVVRLLLDTEMRTRLGVAGHDLQASRYTWEAVAATHRQVFQNLRGSKSL